MGTESPEINPHIQSTDFLSKVPRIPQWRRDNLFNNWCYKNWIFPLQSNSLDFYFIPYIKISWKWIKHLYLTSKTINYLKENRWKLWHGLNNDFLYMTPSTENKRQNKEKWDHIKLNGLYATKEAINRVKRWKQHGRKYFCIKYLIQD